MAQNTATPTFKATYLQGRHQSDPATQATQGVPGAPSWAWQPYLANVRPIKQTENMNADDGTAHNTITNQSHVPAGKTPIRPSNLSNPSSPRRPFLCLGILNPGVAGAAFGESLILSHANKTQTMAQQPTHQQPHLQGRHQSGPTAQEVQADPGGLSCAVAPLLHCRWAPFGPRSHRHTCQ
jgi:hypothetical protein